MLKNIALHVFSTIILLQSSLFSMIENDQNAKRLAQQNRLEEAINVFAKKSTTHKISDFINEISLIEVHDEKDPLNFFGIHKDKQEKVDFSKFRECLLKKMGLEQDCQIIEVIGDSSKFDPSKTKYIRDFFKEQLNNTSKKNKFCIEYGYTGYITSEELDANSVVNDYLERSPEMAPCVLANIVGHSIVALRQWGCTAPFDVKNFVVIYDDNGFGKEYTKFGDDVIASDYLLDPKYDKIICFEGGCQSFKQVVNALSHGVRVDLVSNLRKPEPAKYFSTARFFYLIAKSFADNKSLNKEEVKILFDKYHQTLKSTWDERRPDHKTKKALFEKAIDEFINNETYKKVPTLCTFWNVKDN